MRELVQGTSSCMNSSLEERVSTELKDVFFKGARHVKRVVALENG